MNANDRGIRSFVLRQGRLTPGQKRALDEHWPAYGIEAAQVAGLADRFKNPGELVLEIGFGMGDSLLEMAATQPTRNFIGADVHAPGVGHLLGGIAAAKLDNLQVYHGDSMQLLAALGAASLATVQVFFPDPWPKKRHHKRRLVNDEFLDLVHSRLQPEGMLHLATDWLPYAEVMTERLEARTDFAVCPVPWRPQTKYERRGVGLGHTVTDIAVIAVSPG